MDVTSCVIMFSTCNVLEIRCIMEIQLVRASKLLVYGHPVIRCNVRMCSVLNYHTSRLRRLLQREVANEGKFRLSVGVFEVVFM
jgi:hypothetical protein